MKSYHLITWLIVAILMGCRAMPAAEQGNVPLRLYELQSGRTLQGAEALAAIDQASVVLVGEHHTDRAHHQAQLAVIKALVQAGRPVAVGLEMFRQDSQPALDQWVAGQIDEQSFEKIYLDNWNFDWTLYRPIFRFAREQGLPMVALNVDPSISHQVAYHGFDSLTQDQKAQIGQLQCDVTPAYREYIRQAFGGHGHGQTEFDNFCQAQLLWDSAMAIQALEYVQAHPETTLVILSGSGHAQKPGIPAQIAKRGPWPCSVILPQTPGIFDADHTTAEEADYLFLFNRS